MNYHQNLAQTNWELPPEQYDLPHGEVHLWRWHLDVKPAVRQALESHLHPTERERFAAFHYARDRHQHTVARSRLRQLLGGYLGLPPKAVKFNYAAHGKPVLPSDFSDLQFNLSHAGGWGLAAVTRTYSIGVDVEPIHDSFSVAALVRRFFSPREIPVVLAGQHRSFYLAWTRKEAIIKAHGDGLALPLHQFGVTVEDQEPVRVLHLDWAPEEVPTWRLHSFMVAENTPGAVAWRGPEQTLRFFTFSEQGVD
ncbi:MAG: 4'-phosphopantetheinyl transferase superfamily protein [Bacteroidota bacterium]